MIHFVYKAARHDSTIGKITDKLALSTSWFPATWRNGNHIPWKRPLKHPHSASFYMLEALKNIDKVKFYDIWEERVCKIKPGDKFLGTPLQSWKVNTYKDPSVYKISARTLDKFRELPESDKTVIMPYTHDPLYNLATNDFMKEHGQNLIIVSHKFWTDSWDRSPIKGYVKNLLRVNMAVDASDYPVVKKKFNPKGKRKFLYVGNTNYYKNTQQLEAIAAAIPGFQGGHIGLGQIKGWKQISDFSSLTPEFMSKIAEEYDIFLNTSSADASPATILEHMCFGFPIACTPESSYEYDTITRLHVSDTAFNCEAINKLQYTDEAEFFRQAKKNREYAIKYHNWDDFCAKVINFVYHRPKNANGLFLVD